MTSATRKDVQQEQETETEVVASENPRNNRLEEIAEENHRLMLEELGQKEQVEDAPTQDEAPNTPADPHSVSEDDLANMRVKTKVDGIEEEHSVADLIKSYQKDSAASRRLEEAAKKQREIDARAAELDAREAALNDAANKPDDGKPPRDRDAKLSEAISALYEGDEDRTKAAFNELFEGERLPATQPQESVDPAVIAEQVRQRIRNEDAMAKFHNDYETIVSDPFLVKVADTYLAQALQDGIEYGEALKKAGDSTLEWLKTKGVGANKTSREEKLSRKHSLDEPTTTGTRSAGAEEAPIETSEQAAANIIAEMRRARGLPA